MKRLLTAALLALSSTVFAATLNPVQLINPAGSTAGQAIVSTGATTAPAWGNVTATALAAQAANTVVANVTGSSASPTAFAMPSCSATGNALKWTSNTGFTCATGYALLSAPSFTSGVGIAGGLAISTGGASIAAGGLSVVGPVSGTGFSNYLAAPPCIGCTTPGAGTFTTLKASNSKVIANNTNAQSIPNNTSTVVTTWTSVLNQGANFVTSTGVYTAPAAGTYRVSAGLQFASVTWAAGNVISIQVRQNGATIYQSTNIVEAAVTQPLYSFPISVVLNCAANDTISVSVLQTQGGAVALSGTATNNFLMISQEP
jgi:hypothetical protein